MDDKKLVVGPKGSFEVREKFCCESKGVIYCIECKRCGQIYVGETCRKLKDRFKEHRLDVINRRTEKEVGSHFNSDGHSVQDMSVSGLKYEASLIMRKFWEQKIISMIGCILGAGGMNTDVIFPQAMD